MPAHMLPKPKRGSATAMQRARRRLVEVREKAAKDAAKSRDSWHCRRCHAWCGARAEAAHLDAAGMGGNPDGSRGNHQRCYITLCHSCHQGPRSVHSGHVRIEAGPQGGDWRVRFVDKASDPNAVKKAVKFIEDVAAGKIDIRQFIK